MKFPIIKVRDKGTDEEGFFLGTDHHHKLILDGNGDLQFFNAQCCDGTGELGTYEFIAQEGHFGFEIELVDIVQLLNIYKDTLGLNKHRVIKTRFEKVMSEFCKVLYDYSIIQDKEEKEKEMMDKLRNIVRKKTKEDRIDDFETLNKLAEITTRAFDTVIDDIPSRYRDSEI